MSQYEFTSYARISFTKKLNLLFENAHFRFTIKVNSWKVKNSSVSITRRFVHIKLSFLLTYHRNIIFLLSVCMSLTFSFFSLFFFRTPVKLTWSSSQYQILICTNSGLIKISNFFFLNSISTRTFKTLKEIDKTQNTRFWEMSNVPVFKSCLAFFSSLFCKFLFLVNFCCWVFTCFFFSRSFQLFRFGFFWCVEFILFFLLSFFSWGVLL